MDADDRVVRSHVTTPEDGFAVLAARLWGLDGRPAWHEHAACRDAADDSWFDKTYRPLADRLRTTYCDHCPVLDACREDILAWEDTTALGTGMLAGYVAGMTVGQRRAAIRARRSPQQGSDRSGEPPRAA